MEFKIKSKYELGDKVYINAYYLLGSTIYNERKALIVQIKDIRVESDKADFYISYLVEYPDEVKKWVYESDIR